MTSRREFLQIGVTATALPFASRAARVPGIDLGAGEPVPLYAVVYDTRFAESVEFGRQSRELGLETVAIAGDMTRFWYEDLAERWRQGPAAIAGLTAHGPLFCFEQLARGQGVRVVFRAEHRPMPGGTAHAFSGPSAMLAEALQLGRRRGSFGVRMADVVAHCPRGRNEIVNASAETAAKLELPGDDDALYTWVIAPASKV